MKKKSSSTMVSNTKSYQYKTKSTTFTKSNRKK